MMINSMPAPISSGVGGISRVVDGFKFRNSTSEDKLIDGLIAVCVSTPQGELVHMVGPATTPDSREPFTLVFPDGLTPPPDGYPLQYLRNVTTGGLEAGSKPVDETFWSPKTTVYYDAWYLS